jgi:hypothetical protein
MINGGDDGCDDTYSKTMTGTYTAMTTWFRSRDGRGTVGLFETKIVQNWTFDGTAWDKTGAATVTTTNYAGKPPQYCM